MTPEQEAAVRSNKMDIKIIAAAGSGKTYVLQKRIQRLIDDGADPASILAFTFTRQAARELQDRVQYPIVCDTFHAICYDLLSRFSGERRIIGESECFAAVMDAATELGIAYHKGNKLVWRDGSMRYWISAINKQRREPTANQSSPEYQMTKLYLYDLQATGSIDYEGLLVETLDLLRNTICPLPFKHILVDEAQDSDSLQWDLVDAIRSQCDSASLCCVGDLRQSLYGWRNARPDLFRDRPGCTFHLTKTFRVPTEINSAANIIISKTENHGPPVTSVVDGGRMTVNEESIEACVLGLLSNLHTPGEIAVLCRSNWMVDDCTKKLTAIGLKCANVPATETDFFPFWLLQYSQRPGDHRIRSIFGKFLHGLGIRLPWISGDIEEVYAELLKVGSPTASLVADALAQTIGQFPNVSKVMAPLARIDGVVGEYAHQFAHDHAGQSIKAALVEASMPSSKRFAPDHVVVCTVHQAKGLEYEAVVVAGCNEGEFPVPAALKKAEVADEERRIMYVAMTRAQEQCIVQFDIGKAPSLFAKEIIQHLSEK
jgi:DNA helicase-2/ATP-dependent DNA helicase PcrA